MRTLDLAALKVSVEKMDFGYGPALDTDTVLVVLKGWILDTNVPKESFLKLSGIVRNIRIS